MWLATTADYVTYNVAILELSQSMQLSTTYLCAPPFGLAHTAYEYYLRRRNELSFMAGVVTADDVIFTAAVVELLYSTTDAINYVWVLVASFTTSP